MKATPDPEFNETRNRASAILGASTLCFAAVLALGCAGALFHDTSHQRDVHASEDEVAEIVRATHSILQADPDATVGATTLARSGLMESRFVSGGFLVTPRGELVDVSVANAELSNLPMLVLDMRVQKTTCRDLVNRQEEFGALDFALNGQQSSADGPHADGSAAGTACTGGHLNLLTWRFPL